MISRSSVALLIALLPGVVGAASVPCPAGTRVIVGDAATSGEVVAAGRHLLHVVTEAEPDGTWLDVRQHVVRPAAKPGDRCLASAPDDVVSFGPETPDDDDPPPDED